MNSIENQQGGKNGTKKEFKQKAERNNRTKHNGIRVIVIFSY